MSEWRTWADVLAAEAAPPVEPFGEGGVRMMGTAVGPTEPPAVGYAGPLIDRHSGGGPPPCCPRRRIGADLLVWYGGIGVDALARVRAALPNLEGVPDEDVYLCDVCRVKVGQARVLAPEETPRAWPVGGGGAT